MILKIAKFEKGKGKERTRRIVIHLERSILERRDPSSVASRSTWDGMTTKIRLVIFQKIFFAFVAAILFFLLLLLFLSSYFLPPFSWILASCLGRIFLIQAELSSLMRERERLHDRFFTTAMGSPFLFERLFFSKGTPG